MIFWIVQTIVYFILKVIYRLKIEGLEHLPLQGPVIVACNHVSNMDGAVISTAVSRIRRPRFFAKQELFSYPLSSWFFRSMGAFPVDRHKKGGDFEGVQSAVEVLSQGECLVLLPEGTRSKTGGPGRPKRGIGLLAHQTGVPVVPVRIWNSLDWMKLKTIRVKFGAPRVFDGSLLRQGSTRKGHQIFAEQVMEDIFAIQS